jgi:hypothetical protein
MPRNNWSFHKTGGQPTGRPVAYSFSERTGHSAPSNAGKCIAGPERRGYREQGLELDQAAPSLAARCSRRAVSI